MGRVLVWLIAAIITLSLQPALSAPKHAIAMQDEPALPAGYAHFNYVNPDAPKGGSITYCVVGSFDNLNPFILKSLRTTARGMIDRIFGNLVFEPLMQRNDDEAFSLYGLLADTADMDPERKSIEFHLD
ncbi:MAG: ABC transporter substrate-binding protein, partial [Mesorhizobium sp.]